VAWRSSAQWPGCGVVDLRFESRPGTLAGSLLRGLLLRGLFAEGALLRGAEGGSTMWGLFAEGARLKRCGELKGPHTTTVHSQIPKNYKFAL
jgi:hypothetical protein